MKMSTKSRYGLRALADLAAEGSTVPVPLSRIAERQKLSLKYLEQEFASLKKAGFVRSVKGSQGGYLLAIPANEIIIAEVIKQLEGDLLLVDEPIAEAEQTPLRRCLYDALWQPLNTSLELEMQSLDLAQLVEEWQSGSEENPMYYI